ncbi:hypothetical protein BDQ17DRAFT_1332030 [Cyathus striatus]|nr:hypothetical protein BDQ17DRAFT_1332030 [Cyathus striatus]
MSAGHVNPCYPGLVVFALLQNVRKPEHHIMCVHDKMSREAFSFMLKKSDKSQPHHSKELILAILGLVLFVLLRNAGNHEHHIMCVFTVHAQNIVVVVSSPMITNSLKPGKCMELHFYASITKSQILAEKAMMPDPSIGQAANQLGCKLCRIEYSSLGGNLYMIY